MKIEEWTNHEKLEFGGENFGSINLIHCKSKPNNAGFDFNTELLFTDCKIESFIANGLTLGKSITFNNCLLGGVYCHATYFIGGLKMYDCHVKNDSTFGCGVHNISPSNFTLERTVFDGHLDFYDVYFEGPVLIKNNHFNKGTSLSIYLGVPYGIKKGIPYTVEDNKGEMEKLSLNDPHYKKLKQ